MLTELFIENVAVIERAEIRFFPGLNVLTGETGAGKSILIDAINAILGNRTTKDIVRSGAGKAVIWAQFEQLGENVRETLAELGFDGEEGLLLYREISSDGGSRCRVNQRPATAAAVRELCQNLINIHGQHDNQDLLNPDRHIFLLDNFAGLGAAVSDYAADYRRAGQLKREIESLSADETAKERQMDLLRYQIEEIEKAEFFPGEDEELSARRTAIRNYEKILESLRLAADALGGDDESAGAVTRIYDSMESMAAIAPFGEEYAALHNTLSELYYAAGDAADKIGESLSGFDYDPSMLSEIEERLDLIFRMKRKYGGTLQEISGYLENAKNELEMIETGDERRIKMEAEYAELALRMGEKADALSARRKEAFLRFETRIKDELFYLNMPGAAFQAVYRKTEPNPRGQDAVEFYLSTNTGETPKPLARIASGGELSRIMLAIKNAMAEKDEVDTLIFDEIDSGVSGNSAFKIGKKLNESARSRQTICVTHSAQIASFADNHLLIEKNVRDGRTYTSVQPLSYEQQKRELARIISGDNITGTSLENAAEMLKAAKDA